jgi:hypothetical protein
MYVDNFDKSAIWSVDEGPNTVEETFDAVINIGPFRTVFDPNEKDKSKPRAWIEVYGEKKRIPGLHSGETICVISSGLATRIASFCIILCRILFKRK